MFFRKITTRKNGKEYVYVKLIENYRSNGRIKQRVVANFGSLENLSPQRISDLINSLQRLYQDIEQKQDNKPVVEDLLEQSAETIKTIRNCPMLEPLKQLFSATQYQILEAIIIKSLIAPELNRPIQELCQQLGLVDASSIEFYNVLKKLGETEFRPLLDKVWLTGPGAKEEDYKVIYIHPINGIFKGATFLSDPTGNPYATENYQKEYVLWLAYNSQGVPLDFTRVEEMGQLKGQLNRLVQRLEDLLDCQVVVMDADGILTDIDVPYPVASLAKGLTRGVNPNQYYSFQAIQIEPENEVKIKEIKANLAKVSAGLENIKADILLGKLTKENVIKKRAEAVIRTNGCQEMVSFFYNDTNKTLNYYIKDDVVEEKTKSLVTSQWVVPKEKFKDNINLPQVTIKNDRFRNITDQLNIPPINLYADFHYSREIISGHIALEIIKNQITMVANIPRQGGDS